MPPCWISLVCTQSIIPARFTEPEGAVEKRTQVLEIGWKRVRTDVKVRSRSEPTESPKNERKCPKSNTGTVKKPTQVSETSGQSLCIKKTCVGHHFYFLEIET